VLNDEPNEKEIPPMNAKRMTWLVGIVLILVTAQTGWSFYNPSTGRWLNY